jgi:hypothetical protein
MHKIAKHIKYMPRLLQALTIDNCLILGNEHLNISKNNKKKPLSKAQGLEI